MMVFIYLLLVLFWFFPAYATTAQVVPFNPPLAQAASLLQSFQKQVEGNGDRLSPASLTKDLYTAGQIVTGQHGTRFDPYRSANEQEKRLYLTIAFTMGVDLAARWKLISFYDIATYFEKCFGLKSEELLYTQPHVLASKHVLQHCFFITLAALVGYQAITTSLSNAFTIAQAHYACLQNVIKRNCIWLEPLLNSIHKENGNLYRTLNKVYTKKENCYYLLREESKSHVLEISPKPLHFTRRSPLILTPWHPSPKDQLRHFINDYIPSKATISTFGHKIRDMGFIIMSLEEAQNFFIALWLYSANKAVIEALSQGLDQDLYEAFSAERKNYTGPYFGVTIPFQETAPPSSLDEEKPLLVLQLLSRGFNLTSDS